MSNKDLQNNELLAEINFVEPTPDSYDAEKLRSYVLDEYAMCLIPTKEELIKAYQRIIDKHLQFTHVIRLKK